jgi:hypothetical protein
MPPTLIKQVPKDGQIPESGLQQILESAALIEVQDGKLPRNRLRDSLCRRHLLRPIIEKLSEPPGIALPLHELKCEGPTGEPTASYTARYRAKPRLP